MAAQVGELETALRNVQRAIDLRLKEERRIAREAELPLPPALQRSGAGGAESPSSPEELERMARRWATELGEDDAANILRVCCSLGADATRQLVEAAVSKHRSGEGGVCMAGQHKGQPRSAGGIFFRLVKGNRHEQDKQRQQRQQRQRSAEQRKAMATVAATATATAAASATATATAGLRGYQAEAVRLARDRNAIIVMPTGAGKTKCAVHVARHKLRQAGSGKAVLFVVETRAVVEQQAQQFRRDFPELKVIECAGGTPMADRVTSELWPRIVRRADVVVCTAGVFSSRLRDGQLADADLGRERMVLVVFDECHHCMEGPWRNSRCAR